MADVGEEQWLSSRPMSKWNVEVYDISIVGGSTVAPRYGRMEEAAPCGPCILVPPHGVAGATL